MALIRDPTGSVSR